jgi:hypothetical protein
MVTPKDILFSARLLIREHGSSAEEFATKRMWEFRQTKDDKAAATWSSIVEGIKELRNMFSPKDLS